MKIICPEHNGLIEVPDKLLIEALRKKVKSFVIHCVVCEDEVLITDIEKETPIEYLDPTAV
jgi:hypothetical protein